MCTGLALSPSLGTASFKRWCSSPKSCIRGPLGGYSGKRNKVEVDNLGLMQSDQSGRFPGRGQLGDHVSILMSPKDWFEADTSAISIRNGGEAEESRQPTSRKRERRGKLMRCVP